MDCPEVQDGILTLLLRWGNEPWLLDAEQCRDDAGLRLQVRVVDHLYTEDVLPRRLVTMSSHGDTTCFLVVIKVPDPLPGPQHQRLLAAIA